MRLGFSSDLDLDLDLDLVSKSGGVCWSLVESGWGLTFPAGTAH